MRTENSRNIKSYVVFKSDKQVAQRTYARLHEPFNVRREVRRLIRSSTKRRSDSFHYETLDKNGNFVGGEWRQFSHTSAAYDIYVWHTLDGKTHASRQNTKKGDHKNG